MLNKQLIQRQWEMIYYFFSPAGWKVVSLMVLTILYAFVEMAAVAALFPVLQAGVDSLTVGSGASMDQFSVKSFYVHIGEVLHTNYLMTAGIVLIVITLIAFGYRVYYLYFGQKVLARLWVHHQKGIYSVLNKAEYAFYTGEQQGKLIYNTSVATESIGGTVDSLIRAVSESIKALFLLVLMFVSSWEMTSFILVVGVIYILFSRKIIQRMVYTSSKERLVLNQKQHQNLNEFITGVKVIKVFNQGVTWMSSYLEMARRNANLLIQIHLGTMLPGLIIQMVIGVGIGLVGVYVGMQPSDVIVALIPTLGLFVVALSKVNGSLSTAITYFSAVARYIPDLRAVYNLLQDTPVVLQKEGKALPFKFEKEISFKNIVFSYEGNTKKVLHDVSFNIQKNTTVALVGASGGGKTTVLNLLLRLFKQQQGRVSVDGVEVDTIDLSSYLNGIGFVSQESFLFNGSIIENILFGRKGSEDEVREACVQADADGFISALPEGYQTMVGDNGLKLSGGQKQRLGIARALLKKPELLILDEPTSALDSQSERRIQETLEKITNSITVVIVAHRLSSIQHADKIIVMKDGSVIEEGKHNELLDAAGYYANLYQKLR